MTRFDPSIIVTRVYVERNGAAVYDERFHAGVNIIRGENSSGKSTILNFIFYGLGGDLADWSEVALRCNRVILEVSLNGKAATLSRDISSETGQPMDIFGGDMDLALAAPRAEWVRYPYKRSASKESFSQALFRLLHMPEVSNDVSGNVTMNQILRLLYADQLSPIENIFKFERFDPPMTRDAVGRLLCGTYENQLYENELRLRELNKEFDVASSELRSLISVLGKAQEGMTLQWIAAQRKVLEQRRESIRSEIADAERRFFATRSEDKLSLASQDQAYATVQRLQEKMGITREKRDALAFAIADSAHFIESLEQKLKSLNDAETVAEYVGEIRFENCPVCLAEIGALVKADECHLCKTPLEKERVKSRIVGLINDTALQLKQSRSLQGHRDGELKKLGEMISELEAEWRSASIRLSELRKLPSSEIQDTLRALQRQAGYIDREAEDLENKTSIAQLVDQLSTKKASLNTQISRLKEENEILQSRQLNRRAKAYALISDEVRTLLKNDLRRQDSFENPQNIQFDFAGNNITVDGQRYFSASSRVILKSSFFAGFLAAATKESFFRHPRFCIIDTIEDKGMEPVRSHNFQLQLARVSREAKCEHQIIFATAMIVPDLDEDPFIIGKYSTRDDPTLVVPD